MNYNQEKWIKYIFLLIFCINTNISGINAACATDGPYIIRNIKSGLVMEAGPSGVILEYFDGYAPQLWSFEIGTAPGLFYIVSQLDRKVVTAPSVGVHNATTNNPTDSLFQQWFINGDNSITNAGSKYVLDCYKAHYLEGDPVQLWEPNGTDAQKFVFQEKLKLNSNHTQ